MDYSQGKITLFEWEGTYSVKHQAFDTQRKKLFAMVSELQNATANGHEKDKDVLVTS